MPKRVVKQTLRLVKEVRKNKDYQKNMARRFGSNTVNKFSGSAGFERFIYLKGNYAVLFRFKKAGIKNQPLVIYFGGAGTIGRDNFKPLFEFFLYRLRLSLSAEKMQYPCSAVCAPVQL